MDDFVFQVELKAVVRVRAANEDVARKVVPTVLGRPGNTEIALANENNLVMGCDAAVESVDFAIGSINLSSAMAAGF